MLRSKTGLISALILSLVATVALGAALNFSWTNATTNVDGSTIPATGPGSITSTIVSYGPCNPGRTDLASVTGTVTAVGAATFSSSPDLPPGDWCGFAVHTNTYGEVSDPSNVAFRAVAPPKPRAPSNFTLG